MKGAPGRGTLEQEKPPIVGMIERGGRVVLRMLDNVQQRTIRPHRGISQERLPLYLGFFQFVHNVRRRGRGLLPPMLSALLAGTV